jgi:hypothetical protein
MKNEGKNCMIGRLHWEIPGLLAIPPRHPLMSKRFYCSHHGCMHREKKYRCPDGGTKSCLICQEAKVPSKGFRAGFVCRQLCSDKARPECLRKVTEGDTVDTVAEAEVSIADITSVDTRVGPLVGSSKPKEVEDLNFEVANEWHGVNSSDEGTHLPQVNYLTEIVFFTRCLFGRGVCYVLPQERELI